MSHRIDPTAWTTLFTESRSQNGWFDKPVGESLLQELYEITRMGPTSMNCQPARLVFLTTEAAKARLLPALMPGNVEKTRTAPVVAIVAYDSRFFEHLATQFPAMPGMGGMFASSAPFAQETALRNSSLQGAYLIIAARMLGLDAGPMSGFDAAKVNDAFFADGRWKANFLVNLGYGDPAGNHPRGPRLAFDEIARIE